MKLASLLSICFGLLMSFEALADNSTVTVADDSALYVKGLAKDDLCGRFMAQFPLESKLVSALHGRTRLSPPDVDVLKKDLKCVKGYRDYCETVRLFNLEGPSQTIELAKSDNTLGAKRQTAMNGDRTIYKLTMDNDTFQILTFDIDGYQKSSNDLKMKFVSGKCVPWSYKSSIGSPNTFDLSKCSDPKMAASCDKQPFWKLYQSLVPKSDTTNTGADSKSNIKSTP